jgi:Xaa-Pro dipeptidase
MIPKAPPAIGLDERRARVAKLAAAMGEAKLDAVLLGPTTGLRYFTGVSWHPSERFTGAIVHRDGRLDYVCPGFERDKVAGLVTLPGEMFTWEEDEKPSALIAGRVNDTKEGTLGLDDQMALFFYRALAKAMDPARLADAGPVINAQRSRKSATELALMQHAKTVTLEVQRRAWKSLEAGMRASEVESFIDAQHRALGGSGNIFCIVSFGSDTSLPHGGETDRALAKGDVVLIDTGTSFDGYNSDITRTYVFGEPTADVRRVWDAEKRAQAAAFAAAKPGAACESVDYAARASLVADGFGPDYKLPGTPHRTGHGIGLDVHEAPNLVRGDKTPLAPGMCFSNEPMIVVPGQFGVRLEDHFYMTDTGARWFTEPSASLDEPFKGVAPLG